MRKDTDHKIKTIIVSAYIKDNIPYDKSYTMTIDKILDIRKTCISWQTENRNTAIANYWYNNENIKDLRLNFLYFDFWCQYPFTER